MPFARDLKRRLTNRHQGMKIAGVKDQRLDFVGDRCPVEAEEDDVVIAGGDFLLERAFQPGRRVGKEKRAVSARFIVQAQEAVAGLLGQLTRSRGMAIAQE